MLVWLLYLHCMLVCTCALEQLCGYKILMVLWRKCKRRHWDKKRGKKCLNALLSSPQHVHDTVLYKKSSTTVIFLWGRSNIITGTLVIQHVVTQMASPRFKIGQTWECWRSRQWQITKFDQHFLVVLWHQSFFINNSSFFTQSQCSWLFRLCLSSHLKPRTFLNLYHFTTFNINGFYLDFMWKINSK